MMQYAVIELLTKEEYRLLDIHRRLRNLHGDDTVEKSNVHRWINKFKDATKHTLGPEPSTGNLDLRAGFDVGANDSLVTASYRGRVTLLTCAFLMIHLS